MGFGGNLELGWTWAAMTNRTLTLNSNGAPPRITALYSAVLVQTGIVTCEKNLSTVRHATDYITGPQSEAVSRSSLSCASFPNPKATRGKINFDRGALHIAKSLTTYR